MSPDFTPTHRTNRAIGQIKAGSPIRVARYIDPGFFDNIFGRLGAESYHIEYRYSGDDVNFWDSRVRTGSSRYVFLNDYVITDGEHFEVSNTDSGWDLLPVTHTLDLTHDGYGEYYISFNNEDPIATVTASELHKLSKFIQDTVPEPFPFEDARFVSARTLDHGEFRTLAKIDGIWYDHNGDDYMDIELLANYDEIEVIK